MMGPSGCGKPPDLDFGFRGSNFSGFGGCWCSVVSGFFARGAVGRSGLGAKASAGLGRFRPRSLEDHGEAALLGGSWVVISGVISP